MTYTAKGMSVAIGQLVSIRMESLNIECEIMDVKSAYGKARLLVKPVSGTGEQWIELGRVLRALVQPAKATNNNRITP